MRKDFAKLLCERERPQSKNKFRDVRNSKHITEFEGRILTPSYAFGYDYKDFNENLNPLKKYLHKQTGREWNDIYSELCKAFDRRSVINQHIFDHLFQYVETHAFMKDDEQIYFVKTYAGQAETRICPIHESPSLYYVHPNTGILLAVPDAPRRAPKAEDPNIKVIGDKEYRRVDGVWYEVEMVTVEPRKMYQLNADGTKSEYWTTGIHWDTLQKKSVVSRYRLTYAKTKRQLSYKEKKKLNLC